MSGALDACIAAPADAQRWQAFVAISAHAVQFVARLPKQDPLSTSASETRALIRRLGVSGLHERIAGQLPACELSTKGWPGLLARMLHSPGWMASPRVPLDEVPDWLWGDFAEWCFRSPGLLASEADINRFTDHFATYAGELARWAERNPGSAAVRAALECYLARVEPVLLRASTVDLKEFAAAHARMITRLQSTVTAAPDPVLQPRAGRKVRVGFVISELQPTGDGLSILPLVSHLSGQGFEVSCFVLRGSDSRAERFVRESVQSFDVLPVDLSEQTALVANAQLDCLVFAADLMAATGEIARLATLRLAPLQVVTSAHTAATTGYGTIDLFVAATEANATEAGTFSERLALIQGPPRVWNRDFAEENATSEWSREMLGLTKDARVFVVWTALATITEEQRQRWARLLATDSRYCLLIIPTVEGSVAAERLMALFESALTTHGIASDRVVIIGNAVPEAEAASLLRVASVYLDVPGNDERGAMAALQAGLPVVAVEGTVPGRRRSAAVLRSLGLEEFVMPDAETQLERARQLAGDEPALGAAVRRVAGALEHAPRVFDSLARGDEFGGVLLQAYDELAAVGRRKFRAQRVPVQARADRETGLAAAATALAIADHSSAVEQARLVLHANPTDPAARSIAGKALAALGEYAQAVDYLLAAIQVENPDKRLWFDLARALEANHRMPQALQALETGLRLDPTHADGWVMMIEVAERMGAFDIAREALDELRRAVPDCPAIATLGARLGT